MWRLQFLFQLLPLLATGMPSTKLCPTGFYYQDEMGMCLRCPLGNKPDASVIQRLHMANFCSNWPTCCAGIRMSATPVSATASATLTTNELSFSGAFKGGNSQLPKQKSDKPKTGGTIAMNPVLKDAGIVAKENGILLSSVLQLIFICLSIFLIAILAHAIGVRVIKRAMKSNSAKLTGEENSQSIHSQAESNTNEEQQLQPLQINEDYQQGLQLQPLQINEDYQQGLQLQPLQINEDYEQGLQLQPLQINEDYQQELQLQPLQNMVATTPHSSIIDQHPSITSVPQIEVE